MRPQIGDVVKAPGPGNGSIASGQVTQIERKFEGQTLKGGRPGETLFWVQFASVAPGSYPRWRSEVTS